MMDGTASATDLAQAFLATAVSRLDPAQPPLLRIGGLRAMHLYVPSPRSMRMMTGWV